MEERIIEIWQRLSGWKRRLLMIYAEALVRAPEKQ